MRHSNAHRKINARINILSDFGESISSIQKVISS
jgi:hypothetical protein